VFVAVGIQHATRMRRIILSSDRLYNISAHYVIKGMIFREEKKSIE